MRCAGILTWGLRGASRQAERPLDSSDRSLLRFLRARKFRVDDACVAAAAALRMRGRRVRADSPVAQNAVMKCWLRRASSSWRTRSGAPTSRPRSSARCTRRAACAGLSAGGSERNAFGLTDCAALCASALRAVRLHAHPARPRPRRPPRVHPAAHALPRGASQHPFCLRAPSHFLTQRAPRRSWTRPS